MPQICRRLGPGFGLRLRLGGPPQAAEKGFSPNLWTLPPRYDGKSRSFSGDYRMLSADKFESLSPGRRRQNRNFRIVHSHIDRNYLGAVEPGHWPTESDLVIASKFLMP